MRFRSSEFYQAILELGSSQKIGARALSEQFPSSEFYQAILELGSSQAILELGTHRWHSLNILFDEKLDLSSVGSKKISSSRRNRKRLPLEASAELGRSSGNSGTRTADLLRGSGHVFPRVPGNLRRAKTTEDRCPADSRSRPARHVFCLWLAVRVEGCNCCVCFYFLVNGHPHWRMALRRLVGGFH